MPELPEVEVISRSLDSLLRGRRIDSAELLRERLAPDCPPEVFAQEIGSSTIDLIHRRGKHILFDLSNTNTLLVHLRMSGRFSLLSNENENPKFSHAIFLLQGGERLVFDDQRHFGLMKVIPTSELHNAKELIKLAPEPFSLEFSPKYLASAASSTKRSLKEFLLDQTKVCGLGNIYASEAMHLARLDPTRPANSLKRQSILRLHKSIRAVLQIAIDHSAKRDIDPKNLEGNYFSAGDAADWLVYDRENEPCRTCKTPITRLKQGGRSTYFCRRCQH